MTKYDFITFDCYGTLIDWESGIADAFASAGISADRETVLHAYHAVEPEVEKRAYRSYEAVLTESAIAVAEKLGRKIARDQASFLPRSLPQWKPFSDTNAALEALRDAGCELGILSNVDDELLRQTILHFPVDFELLITAEEVRSYKPAHGHFVKAKQLLGRRGWLHAAQSYFHDVVPAVELGIPVAWINRKAERPSGPARPNEEFADLAGFAAWAVNV